MPGEVSRSNPGPSNDSPYVPHWCYEAPGPRMCRCGDHEGYHNDAGKCLRAAKCGCAEFAEAEAAIQQAERT